MFSQESEDAERKKRWPVSEGWCYFPLRVFSFARTFTPALPFSDLSVDQRDREREAKGFMCGKLQQEGKCSWEFLPRSETEWRSVAKKARKREEKE